jgi:hypothetical protein
LAALRLRLKPTRVPVFSKTRRTLERLLTLVPSGLALPSLSLTAFSTILRWVGLSLNPSAMLTEDGDLDMIDVEDFVFAEEDEEDD